MLARANSRAKEPRQSAGTRSGVPCLFPEHTRATDESETSTSCSNDEDGDDFHPVVQVGPGTCHSPAEKAALCVLVIRKFRVCECRLLGLVPRELVAVIARHLVDAERREVNELHSRFQTALGSRWMDEQMSCMERIVALMHEEVNVSRVFRDVVMFCSRIDVASKRIAYEYLTFHAVRNIEHALLIFGSILRDGYSNDEAVRCLTLQQWSKIVHHVPCAGEYLSDVLLRGIKDQSTDVRIAVLQCLSRQHLPSEVFEAVLLKGLQDRDPKVQNAALERAGDSEAQRSDVVGRVE